jgi:hypothetical protein
MAAQIEPNVSPYRDTKGPETNRPGEPEADVWRTLPQVSLLVENIPSHWMVADLKAFLDDFGNVIKIEIYEDREVSPFL